MLLNKLDNLGVRGIEHSWLKSYLTDRKQYNYGIIQYHITTGEYNLRRPQGSLLWPILFSIFVYDIIAIPWTLRFVTFPMTPQLPADIPSVYWTMNQEFENCMTGFILGKQALTKCEKNMFRPTITFPINVNECIYIWMDKRWSEYAKTKWIPGSISGWNTFVEILKSRYQITL